MKPRPDTMSDHLSKQFDLELESIRTHILEMGGLVESQLAKAIEAFATGNREEMRRIIADDAKVNQFEIDIDAECTRLIAKRQPTARDLRLVLSISRIITDLERGGDKAVKIAKMSNNLYENHKGQIPRLADIRQCGQLAVHMLRRALDSLARMDAESARALIGDDQKIDDAFNGIMRQLITYMMEDPRTIGEALDIVWIAKAIERVGDHATNIAENVVYIVSGEDIRHLAPPTSDKQGA
ncbi:MAG TPA: phosphate signaling complex protein PhoU [Rhodocyclaceae bacterium]|nr:phosphate signaling complex protein PhoU [Rhodocyclaceae bacterium]